MSDRTIDWKHSTITTTDASGDTIDTIPLVAGDAGLLEVFLVAHGVTSNNRNCYVHHCTISHIGGTAVAFANITTYGYEQDSAWDVTCSTAGNDIIIVVTGDATENVEWSAYRSVYYQ